MVISWLKYPIVQKRTDEHWKFGETESMGIVLHIEDPYIKEHMMEGMVGLEMESLRVDRKGRLSQTPHPFPDDPVIDRDFGEAQIEIGTEPRKSVQEAVDELKKILCKVQGKLSETGELLWPFSNPPVLFDEDDIVIARYTGDQEQKTVYRQYLAEKYGKYKMTFSGIHFNYSFSEELIKRNMELDQERDLSEYRDRFYLELAQKVLQYGWLVVALLAASPIADASFFSRSGAGRTAFTGKSSLRCSESGYWNFFTPYLDYSSIRNYADSIHGYIANGVLSQATELYYPVRIKNPGRYTLEGLTKNGVDHIELRVIDLNPFSDWGIDTRDAVFMKLFLIWLTSKDVILLDAADQMRSLQNFKNAAEYDWDISRIICSDGKTRSLANAAEVCLNEMISFFDSDGPKTREQLMYQMEKVRNKSKRYAQRVLSSFGDQYMEQGLKRANAIQEAMNVRDPGNQFSK